MSQTTAMLSPDTPRLLVVSGICSFSDGSTDILIEKTPFVLGRWGKCDGVVKPLEVSRKHCEIVKEEGAYRLRDLGSTNKTFVNDLSPTLTDALVALGSWEGTSTDLHARLETMTNDMPASTAKLSREIGNIENQFKGSWGHRTACAR